MIQTFTVSPGVTLRCVRDLRFKQNCLSVQFVRPMVRQEAAANALLPAVLLRGCREYDNLQSITRKLDDLYGASVGTMVRRVGDYQTTGFYCSFMEDRFALSGDQVLAPLLDFVGQLLRDPVLENGAFRSDFVDSEKRNLILAIESQRNDKRAWAASQMLKKLCAADSYGISRLGEIEDVEAITPQSLYRHYEKVLRQSPVELFYVGSQSAQQVAELVRPLFAGLDRVPMDLPPQTAFQDSGVTGSYTETMDIAQGKLSMGFVSPITLRRADFAAMQVLNAVLGGGMISKLFVQVREKLSLCYDIGSGFYGSKGILTVSAGIDCKDREQVQQQILAQLAACQAGDISDQELAAAKEGLLSQLRATHDSPGAIEGYYATAALSGLKLDPAGYMQAVEAVTRQDAAQAAQSLRLHTVYFLKGVEA